MKKLDRNYLSFLEWIGLKKPNPEQPRGYSYHGFRYHDGGNQNPIYLLKDPYFKSIIIYPQYQFLGALCPLAKTIKDVVNSIKPYNAKKQEKDDLLQPIHGLRNFLEGIISILAGTLLFVGWLIILPFALLCLPIPFVRNLFALPFLGRVIYPLSWIIEGVCNTIRGTTQVIFSPLTYMVKWPLRTFLMYRQIEPIYAEDKPEIKRLANEAIEKLANINKKIPVPSEGLDDELMEVWRINKGCDETRCEVASLLFEINRKYHKSIENGWQTHLNVESLSSQYVPLFATFKQIASLNIPLNPDNNQDQREVSDVEQTSAKNYLAHFATK